MLARIRKLAAAISHVENDDDDVDIENCEIFICCETRIISQSLCHQ